eukprot:951987-Prorocentrum_minimum.AAC.1
MSALGPSWGARSHLAGVGGEHDVFDGAVGDVPRPQRGDGLVDRLLKHPPRRRPVVTQAVHLHAAVVPAHHQVPPPVLGEVHAGVDSVHARQLALRGELPPALHRLRIHEQLQGGQDGGRERVRRASLLSEGIFHPHFTASASMNS